MTAAEFCAMAPPAGLLGVWALGAFAIAPFAWGWWAPWGLDDETSGPRFDGGVLCAALGWPLMPVAALLILLLAPLIYLTEIWPEHVKRWWVSDWSRRLSRETRA